MGRRGAWSQTCDIKKCHLNLSGAVESQDAHSEWKLVKTGKLNDFYMCMMYT